MRDMNYLKGTDGGVLSLEGAHVGVKRPVWVQVHFATSADLSRTDAPYSRGRILTHEGTVDFTVGTPILTNTRGDRTWPIKRHLFDDPTSGYVPADESTAAGQDGFYHKRPTVVALCQMREPFTVTAAWGDLEGVPGAWLAQDPSSEEPNYWVVSAEDVRSDYDTLPHALHFHHLPTVEEFRAELHRQAEQTRVGQWT